jgi:Flp pilus assembly protein TadG
MRRKRHSADLVRDERGSASIEFITVGLLLLVPTVYLVLALASIQSASFAVEGAARQASRVFVQASTVEAGEAAAERAIAVTLADYGLNAGDAAVAISCRPDPTDCLTRRGFVTVTISIVAPLPLFPAVLETELPLGVPIDSVATEQVSRFAGS